MLALCHALETHRTLDGAMYTGEVIAELEKYHTEVCDAVRENRDVLVSWRAIFES